MPKRPIQSKQDNVTHAEILNTIRGYTQQPTQQFNSFECKYENNKLRFTLLELKLSNIEYLLHKILLEQSQLQRSIDKMSNETSS